MSIRKHHSKAGKKKIWNYSIIINSYRWLYTSLRWLLKLKKFKVPFLQIYYDHLVFDTNNQLQRIYDFLILPHHSNATMMPSDTHELYGSPGMKRDPRKLSRIIYDNEWMQNLRFFLLGPIFIPPAIFNSIYAKKTLVNNKDD